MIKAPNIIPLSRRGVRREADGVGKSQTFSLFLVEVFFYFAFQFFWMLPVIENGYNLYLPSLFNNSINR